MTTLTVTPANLAPLYYELVRAGTKTYEIRAGKGKWPSVKVGTVLEFHNTADTAQSFRATVVEVIKIDGPRALERLLEEVGLGNALPGVKSIEEGAAIYYDQSGPIKWKREEVEQEVGVMAMKLVVEG